jgi:hypothetical protein
MARQTASGVLQRAASEGHGGGAGQDLRSQLAQRIVAVVQDGEKGLDGIVGKVLNPGA